MLVRAEISRKHLEVENPELLLAPFSQEQRVEPVLIVSGSIGSDNRVGSEKPVEPVTYLFHGFTLTLHKFERNAVHRFGRLSPHPHEPLSGRPDQLCSHTDRVRRPANQCHSHFDREASHLKRRSFDIENSDPSIATVQNVLHFLLALVNCRDALAQSCRTKQGTRGQQAFTSDFHATGRGRRIPLAGSDLHRIFQEPYEARGR